MIDEDIDDITIEDDKAQVMAILARREICTYCGDAVAVETLHSHPYDVYGEHQLCDDCWEDSIAANSAKAALVAFE